MNDTNNGVEDPGPEQIEEWVSAVERKMTDSQPVEVVRIDDVYPWWEKLRLPALLFSIAMMCISIAVAALVIDDIFDDRREAVAADRQDCRQAMSNRITEAASRTRLTSGVLDNIFNQGILEIYQSGDLQTLNVEAIKSAIDANQEALRLDQEAVTVRDSWFADGEPLPCPVQSTEGS